MTERSLCRGERTEGLFSPFLLLFPPTLNAIPQRGNSHMKVIGVSMTSLGVESADFGLIYGIHGENSIFLPLKVSLRVALK